MLIINIVFVFVKSCLKSLLGVYYYFNYSKSYLNYSTIGTRWCGYGSDKGSASTSLSSNDTSETKKLDECCKEHDHCPFNIPRWKRRYNLLNWRPFTISSCGCDRKFLNCLKKDESLAAKDVKRIYFDILEVPCFDIVLKDVNKCVERTWFMACKKFAMKTESTAEIRRS